MTEKELKDRIEKLERDLADCRAAVGYTIKALAEVHLIAKTVPALFAPGKSDDESERQWEAYREATKEYSRSLRSAMDLVWGPEDE